MEVVEVNSTAGTPQPHSMKVDKVNGTVWHDNYTLWRLLKLTALHRVSLHLHDELSFRGKTCLV